jgi:hypothetical protein
MPTANCRPLSLTVCQCGKQAQHQVVSKTRCSYELPDLLGRPLRRWPRRANLGDIADEAYKPADYLWPVLETHRWLWDV